MKVANNLPSSFRVNHKRYNVMKVKALPNQGRGVVSYDERLMLIARSNGKRYLTTTEQFDTFIHELVHVVLHEMDAIEYNREAFVEPFAQRLSNAFKTSVFEDS